MGSTSFDTPITRFVWGHQAVNVWLIEPWFFDILKVIGNPQSNEFTPKNPTISDTSGL